MRSAQTCHSSRGLSPATPRQTLMTYLVTIISLTPDTRLTEKREAFSMTLMVCVICVETLSRMRFWSRPAGDSRVDDDVVACDGWLDDAIAAVGTLQARGRRGRCLRQDAIDRAANRARAGAKRRTRRSFTKRTTGRALAPRGARAAAEGWQVPAEPTVPRPNSLGGYGFGLDSTEQLSQVSLCYPAQCNCAESTLTVTQQPKIRNGRRHSSNQSKDGNVLKRWPGRPADRS